MKSSKLQFVVGVTLAYAALSFSLAVRAEAQTVDFLAQFTGVQTRAFSLVQATDGNLYGATAGVLNSANYGTIFRMTLAGELSTIYSFCSLPGCADGQQPYASPVLGSDGNLYGVVPYGGNATNSGTFYKMTLGGQLTVLYTFCSNSGCTDGEGPNGVIQGQDGNFYGTTELGGANNSGTFFKVTPTGAFKVLHSFCSQPNCTDGSGANAIQGIDGNFYGTGGGGTFGGGVFYQITPEGAYKVLYNFCFYTDTNCNGSYPSALVQDAEGNFFGTARYGGDSDYGTVFEITAKKYQYRVLHWFDARHGNDPAFGVTLANDGNLYGIATDSGTGDYAGTLFEITPKGVYTPLYTFDSLNEPYDPWNGLFQGTDGLFYGSTLYGTGACCYGAMLSLNNSLNPLVETAPAGGKVGQSIIIIGNGLTGSTSVTFNGVEAAFTVESDTYIKATVPAGAKTGVVSVVTQKGTLNSNPQFVVTK
ncbi:MAG: choice-of-anchor tandem repeat GloVer-containing protein [Candidatus Sulfotelmatobacter sp.]